jgi:hypothetical protein
VLWWLAAQKNYAHVKPLSATHPKRNKNRFGSPTASSWCSGTKLLTQT